MSIAPSVPIVLILSLRATTTIATVPLRATSVSIGAATAAALPGLLSALTVGTLLGALLVGLGRCVARLGWIGLLVGLFFFLFLFDVVVIVPIVVVVGCLSCRCVVSWYRVGGFGIRVGRF